MKTTKVIWISVATLLLVPAVLDAVRYLKPAEEKKKEVQPYRSFPITSANEIVLVYNAWGGIYPGLVDWLHKEVFPKSYPCNLCYQTFGTFGMKEEWKQFLDSLPYTKIELHKDEYKRQYLPEDLTLPVLLISNDTSVQVLASAEEINQQKSLQEMKDLVNRKLNK